MDSKKVLESCRTLRELDNKAVVLNEVAAILNWDQEVYMPEDALHRRSEQLTEISVAAHKNATNPRIGDLLADLESSASSLSECDADYVRCLRRQYTMNTALPAHLVGELTKVTGVAQGVWAHSRHKNDFASFAPHLEKIVSLMRVKASCLNPKVSPYDVLLDLYEPGITCDALDTLFAQVRPVIVSLVQRLGEKQGTKPSFMSTSYPIETQDAFAQKVMLKMGYNTKRGRLDRSVHPFTTTLGSCDVRITTRYHEDNMLSGLFSVIHEAGHALYEQNIDQELAHTSLYAGVSMGIHESQSRLWENIFARSKAFWAYWYSTLQVCYPEQLRDVSLDTWYRAVNYTTPTHIRVDADELTYTLHIILRYELERALIEGSLAVSDVPDAWREKSRELLGIVPETDTLGVLQDVHWSAGLFGYFPSYALGNFYGAQCVDVLKKDITLEKTLETGEYDVIVSWLRQHILRYGSRKFPVELMHMISGKALSAEPFIAYLMEKYAELV